MEIRVYYEDTDIGGVVYYANYLKFIERARSEIFFREGMIPLSITEKMGHFVVRKIEADFLASATLGDLLEVRTTLVSLKGASFELLQTVWKEDVKLFEARVMLAYVVEGKPTKIAEDLKEVIGGIRREEL